MFTGTDRGRPGAVGAEVAFDGNLLEVVEEFVYLETLVTFDYDISQMFVNPLGS